jgi:hypothetical protein
MATASLRRHSRRPSPAMLREAAQSLAAPVTGSVFAPGVQKVLARASALTAAGASPVLVRKQLDRLATADPAPMQVMGGQFGVGKDRISASQVISTLALLDGVYVPGNDTSWWIRPDHHYLYEANHSGYADRMSGWVSASANVDVAAPLVQSTGVVFSQIYTDPASYGQVSQVTFDVDVSWDSQWKMFTKAPWSDKVMGSVQLIGQVFLVIYEFNVASKQWEKVQAVGRKLVDLPFLVNGDSSWEWRDAGTIGPGQLTAKCIVNPTRFYTLGVHAQMSAFNHIVPAPGQSTVPPPPSNQFLAHASVAAHATAMYINHQVFAW